MSKEIPTSLKRGGNNNEEGKERDNSSKPEETRPIDQYENVVTGANRLREVLSETKKQAGQDHANIDQLRESMGLPPDSDLETTTDEYVKGLESQEVATEQKIKDAENTLLGVPEGERDKEESLNKQIKTLVEKEKEGAEQMEKEARGKFVKEFIESAIEKMMDEFRGFLDESKNAEPARQLIKQKTTAEVQNKAKEFIENGGEPNFGFEAEIKGAEFDGSTGEKVKYVTEFNIKFEGVSTAAESTRDKGELLDRQAQKKMQEAEKQGGLEETEEKAA